MKVRLLLCISAAAGLAVGCADRGGKASPSPASSSVQTSIAPEPTTSAKPTTSAATNAVGDATVVSDVLLRASDFPPGWATVGQPSAPTAAENAASREFATCLGVPAGTTTADIDSATFTYNGNYRTSADVFAFTSQTDLEQYEQALTQRGESCLSQVLLSEITQGLPTGASAENPTVTRIGPAPGGTGSEFTVHLTVLSNGQSIPITGVLTSLNIGRIAIETTQIATNLEVVDIQTIEQVTLAQRARASFYHS
jgi:hypothetical protein